MSLGVLTSLFTGNIDHYFINFIAMSSSDDTLTADANHKEISAQSPQEAITHPVLQITDTSQDKNIIYMRNMSLQIEKLFSAINDLYQKMNKLQEEKEAPTGCGFSCTNNSLNM